MCSERRQKQDMKSWLKALSWVAAGLVLVVAIGVGYNRLLAPREASLTTPYSETPDYERITRAITGAALQEDLKTYTALGTRFTGSAGFYKTEEQVLARFRELGCRVVLQEHEVVVPKTRFCRLLGEDGQPLPGIEIYPYYPNRMRTATTPVGGITGTVVFKGSPAEDDKIPALNQCEGNIILLRVQERFQDYANFGARAVLYFLDAENLPKAEYYRRKESHASIDVPVFFIRGDPRSLIGKRLTVQARVDWEPAPVRNLLAIFDADPDASDGPEETLLVSAYYDAWSSIPDLAPGARQLLGLQGLLKTAEHFAASPSRPKFRRKVVFFVHGGMGQAAAGSRQLVSALGSEPEPQKAIEARAKEHDELARELADLREVRELLPRYFAEIRDAKAHAALWRGRKLQLAHFRQELELALDEVSLRAEEDALSARLAWIRAGKRSDESLDLYLATNKRAQIYRSMTSAKPYTLASAYHNPAPGGYRAFYDSRAAWTPGEPTRTASGSLRHARLYEADFDTFLSERLRVLQQRLDRRVERTASALRQNEQDQGVFTEIRGAQGTRRVLGIEVNFSDKTRQLTLASGGWWWATRCIPADREIELQFKYAQEKLFPDVPEKDAIASRVASGDAWSLGVNWAMYDLHTTAMTFRGYSSFVLSTNGDDREFFACPLDTPEEINWDNVAAQERVIIGGLEQLALGRGKIIPTSMPIQGQDFRGVTTSVRGNSLVPNHPEGQTLVQLTGGAWGTDSWAHYSNGGGYWTAFNDPYPLVLSDDLGRFTVRNAFAPRWWTVDFHAARTDPQTGQITWIRDLGYEAKYPTQNLRVYQVRDLTRIVMFRCAPIHIFRAENPKKMQLYDRVEARLVRGFSAPKKLYSEMFYAGENVLYLEPDAEFFPTYLSGSPENPSLLRIAGIGLNLGPEDFARISAADDEIAGRGFLAADATFLYHPEDDLARSMSAINSRRDLKYGNYNLIDAPTRENVQRARDLAREGQRLRQAGQHFAAFETMKDSLAFSTTAHPVIRTSKSEAVYGIVFYLLLLIPFAFFMEKLLLGCSDVRWQIVWVGAIFLAVFMVLRELHPAFEIVRSSFMILLGFITLVLSLLVTGFLGSKFRGAVLEYQTLLRGQQAIAEVTKTGAALTGFLLGINNMRKRKVRTMLTAITLVLITFVMICFTAVESDYVDVMYPIGKAPYTGLEIRKNTLSHLGNQTTVLVQAFENEYDVAARRWDVQGLWGMMPLNKRLEAETYISPDEVDNLPLTLTRSVGGVSRKWTSTGSLDLGPAPNFAVKDVLTGGATWFSSESERSVVLSSAAAAALGIDADGLRTEPRPTVMVAGKEFVVINLFDPARLDAAVGPTGKPVTPLDLAAEHRYATTVQEAELAQRQTLVREGRSRADIDAATKTTREGRAKRVPERLAAAGLVLFPKQRQPVPDAIVSHFKGKLRLSQREPINFDRMFLSKVLPHPEDSKHQHYWFRDDDPDTCFIPDRMAAEMRLTPELVEATDVRIRVEGAVLAVKGIYDAARFDQVQDLDGESLAPYDVESIVGRPLDENTDEDEMPELMRRLSGGDIIVCNDRSRTAGWHVASIAIDFSKAGSHKRVREILDRYLEKTGAKAFYGIGDTAYFGATFRRPRGANYLELLIPLLIASLTVLNTMRGSVYERKDEIYVYNAVGLNPSHVFFLFIAEACVYAVVGALGGYLVANLAGKLVSLLGLSVGLTINYSSIYAVMYSAVIMVAVLVSTWFPARAAARLAAPAEEMKWRVPVPEDGVIRFDLPFTFNARDRVAIVAYFMGWFDEFGEGSSGTFYCSRPTCRLERRGKAVAGSVHTTTWLRPYDLGVSQEVAIHLSEDPDSGQTTARLTLTHLSGGLSVWVRTNYLFLRILRKHFLDWRMVPESEKLGFLQRARRHLGAPEELVQEAQIKIDATLAAAARAEESRLDPAPPPATEAAHRE
jgi:hypothetical protein